MPLECPMSGSLCAPKHRARQEAVLLNREFAQALAQQPARYVPTGRLLRLSPIAMDHLHSVFQAPLDEDKSFQGVWGVTRD